ncbi:type II and III secretion system protein [Prosthecobacter sp.]|uniref:type II secretion system protein GspD n=1 Tax=Prosthecobacter sp. TaxID=1965333 RepID=UPI001DD8A4C4|nr:type II and III secretion system protein [Prosthecobacter sp.]MCB1277363.1 type II and III secretion system protein [Prosthecobacter sp.]
MRYFTAKFQIILCIALTSVSGTVLRAQFNESTMHLMSPEYEIEASRLRAAPPQQYDFSKAMLSDVLRFLATDAGISFFSLPDDSADGSRLITFSIRSSPFQVLETLCKANGLAIIPDNGIWYIRPADDRELIGKSYEIKHNSLEMVERVNSGSGSSSVSSRSGGGGGGGISSAATGMDLQGSSHTFAVKRSEVINDIRALLGLPPEELDGGQATAGIPGIGGAGTDENAARAMNSNELSSVRKPKVIWKSDSNTLYIVATRLQHLWVEGYLAAADKPQTLIAIEVKFIETSRDPSREFGIDWTGTLETGNFRQVTKTDTTTDATTGQQTVNVEYNSVPTSGGFRTDLAPLLSAFDMNNAAKTLGWPALSVLSAQDVNIKLRAMMRDEETNTTSYPRMVTLSNREVAIRSVVNQPVLDASSTASSGAVGATTTTQVAYLPIGTVLNILPKKMQADKVLLNMAVTVSSIIGTQVISGNPYPIASSRVYSAPVEIDSGYTVAVGGLDEAREREGQAGVPFLSKVPGLKWLFNYKSRSKNHKNLMLFITPTIIDARQGGLPPNPQSVVPQRPNLPGKPKVDSSTGALIGGSASLPNTVAYLSREAETLGNTIQESRITDEVGQKLKELKIAVERVHAQCETLKLSEPAKFAMIDQHQLMLKNILDRLAYFQRMMFTKKYL